MTDHGSQERTSNYDAAQSRAFLRDSLPAVAALVLIQGSLIVIDPEGAITGWTLIWSLLPLVPACFLGWAQIRCLRRADEFQRLVQLEAMAIGFGAMVLLAFAGGLLDAAELGDPAQFLQITFIGGILAWFGAWALLAARAG
ncbi:MAG: hypothetical protein ABI586_12190 [Candidatus Nanopelagicales bacterium]